MKWRIYYGNGATFSDQDGTPQDAPPEDVQVVVQKDHADTAHDVGRLVSHGHDFWWFEDGVWFGGDLCGLFDYLRRTRCGVVKFGRYIRNDRFNEIRVRALSDPDFPRFSGPEGGG